MYRKQFLLTTKKSIPFKWKSCRIGNFYLFWHPELEYCTSSHQGKKIHLLGSLFDYENPELSNQNIVDKLIILNSKEALFGEISRFCGEYVIIYEENSEIFLFNDTSAQREVYYDEDFVSFGSQPKLIGEVLDLIPHKDPQAINFYSSHIFLKKKIFAADSTHVKNIFHLKPNHVIHITQKKVERFYPKHGLNELTVEEAADKAVTILTGYLKAISHRHKLILGVTAGYDSRILFLASLGTRAEYYVVQHSYMSDKHYDIVIPRRLTQIYKKKLIIMPDRNDHDTYSNPPYEDYLNSVDFPRYLHIQDKILREHVIINGNISEVARNYFGYFSNLSGEDLSFFNGFSTHPYSSHLYQKYLDKDGKLFDEFGYHILDMFYWEEKMGNWAAKGKTEGYALGMDIISPFNSRELLTTLLGVKRKFRDSHYNKLYDTIIANLAGDCKEVIRLPINPSLKQNIIRGMKKTSTYNIYRKIGLRTRKLKV